MAAFDQAGMETLKAAQPLINDLFKRIDALTAEVREVRQILQEKQLVTRFEDRP